MKIEIWCVRYKQVELGDYNGIYDQKNKQFVLKIFTKNNKDSYNINREDLVEENKNEPISIIKSKNK